MGGFVSRSKKKLCCSYISVFSYCCHHIQWMISNSSWEAGAFFPRLVRRRHRSSEKGTGARRARSRGRMDPRGLQDRGPGEPPRERGRDFSTGPRAAMPPSVRSGRVLLEARSLLRGWRAASGRPEASSGQPRWDRGGPAARAAKSNGAVDPPLRARSWRQEPRLPAPRLNQLCDRPRS